MKPYATSETITQDELDALLWKLEDNRRVLRDIQKSLDLLSDQIMLVLEEEHDGLV